MTSLCHSAASYGYRTSRSGAVGILGIGRKDPRPSSLPLTSCCRAVARGWVLSHVQVQDMSQDVRRRLWCNLYQSVLGDLQRRDGAAHVIRPGASLEHPWTKQQHLSDRRSLHARNVREHGRACCDFACTTTQLIRLQRS